MLVDIYARAMLTATRHGDLPQRPLPEAFRAPPRRPGLLRRALRGLAALRAGLISAEKPGSQLPAPCK